MKKLRLGQQMPMLFDFTEPAAQPAADPAPVKSPAVEKAEAKPETFLEQVARRLREIAGEGSVQKLIAFIGGMTGESYEGFEIYSNTYPFSGFRDGRYTCLDRSRDGSIFRFNNMSYLEKDLSTEENGQTVTKKGSYFLRIVGLDEDVVLKTLKVRVDFEETREVLVGEKFGRPYNQTTPSSCIFTGISVDKWKPMKKVQDLKLGDNQTNVSIWLQNTEDIMDILDKLRPWVRKWIDDCVMNDRRQGCWDGLEKEKMLYRYLYAPHMEILQKAGYLIADKYFRMDVSIPNKGFIQPGTKPSNIFTTKKWVYEILKEEDNEWKWEQFVAFSDRTSLGTDQIIYMYNEGYELREIESFEDILCYRNAAGKPIFTFTGLMNYLARIDMNEAIDRRDGLQYIKDYLATCQQLSMTPRTDSDSLRREHDVAARLLRQRRDEIEAERKNGGMALRKKEMEPFLPALTYGERIYFIRPIFDFEALIDEATQQHNCLACYADNIICGSSVILQMRETAHPEKSLISIELTGDMSTVRQKYLAYNQPIRNRSQLEFIDRWLRHMRSSMRHERIINAA